MRYDIHDIDVRAPLQELAVSAAAAGSALVLRDAGRPCGYVMLERNGPATIGVPELTDLVARECAETLLANRLVEELAPPATATSSISVTAAICTHGRPALVDRCLAGLLALDSRANVRLEILVVDNAPPDDATERVVRQRPSVRYVREDRPGLDFARNRALYETTTDIIAYLDDDVVVDAGWLAGLAQAAADDPRAATITGLVLPLELETEAQILFERRGGFRRGFRRKRYGGETRHDIRWYPCGPGIFGAGCNMAFRVEPLRSMGGFDEALDTGAPLPGGGDLDIFYRTLRAGHTLVYEPAMLVFHQHRRELGALRRQYRSWGEGFMAFLAKTWSREPAQRAKLRGMFVWWLRDQFGQLVHSFRRDAVLPPTMHAAELMGGIRGMLGTYPRSTRRSARIRERIAGPAPLSVPEPRPVPRGFTPWRMVDVPLTEPIRAIDTGPDGAFVVFWTAGLPLGCSEFGAYEMPVPAAWLAYHAAQSIAPAVGQRLIACGFEAPLPVPVSLRRTEVAPLNDVLALDRPLASVTQSIASPAVQADVSVVICTRDRPEALRAALASIAQSTRRPHELIVVDNAPSSDDTRRVAESFGARYVREPRSGLSIARNTGVRTATSEIVAFTDDDVVVHPEWIERIAAAFDDPGVMAATGLVLPAALDTESQWMFERVFGGFGQGYRPLRYDARFLNDTRRFGSPVWRIGAGANMAFRREAFDRVGGFDERLGAGAAGCSEDSELWYRLLSAGEVCAYEPAAVVHHHHRAEAKQLRRQMRDYMRGHVAALAVQFARHGDWGNLYRIAIGLPWYYLRLAVRGFDYGSPRDRRTLVPEIMGGLSGIWYVLTQGRLDEPRRVTPDAP